MSIYEDLEVFTGEDELNTWSTKDFVIGSLLTAQSDNQNNDYSIDTNSSMARIYAQAGENVCGAFANTGVSFSRYANDGHRKIGYISGIMDDGSYILTILGTGIIPLSRIDTRYVSARLQTYATFKIKLDPVHEDYVVDTSLEEIKWVQRGASGLVETAEMSADIGYGGENVWLDQTQGLLYAPQWQQTQSSMYQGFTNKILASFGYMAGQKIENFASLASIQLTNNENTSLTIGNLTAQYYYTPRSNNIFDNGLANIGGALSGIMTNEIAHIQAKLQGVSSEEIHEGNNPLHSGRYELAMSTKGTYAGYYCPFNLILTRNLEEAKTYLTTGILPSDAFLYPFDVDNIPINDSGEDPEPEPVEPDTGGDVPNEDGEPKDNVDPTPTADPTQAPITITNNNLYWLSSVEVKNFINWFWTDASDIASVGDLWDKIRGLYENLAQAVLNIRYMPVQVEWIGGASPVPSIIVGQIEKQGGVLSLNKKLENGQIVSNGTVAPKRQLGTIKIPKRFNGGFANYSPYATLSLWLPFHGFVDLDIDLFYDKNSDPIDLAVECAYDIISGTIQYFVFRGGYGGQIVQTCVAKMAVDIPITLQSKNERDSATFQNVSNAIGSLLGAGASAVAGSPIGLTMAMGNFAGTQTQGAGLTVKGTVGETGAFYQPSKCAIYVKRPNYNKPDCYASRVGYPSNTSKQLKSVKGFAQVYNPYIEFTHTVKPYKEEIDMIYNYLEEGVIL